MAQQAGKLCPQPPVEDEGLFVVVRVRMRNVTSGLSGSKALLAKIKHWNASIMILCPGKPLMLA